MNKKGFTLIELLGSIVILAIITLFAFPAILNLIDGANTKIDKSMQDFVITAAREYVNDDINSFPRSSGNEFVKIKSIKVYDELVSKNYISDEIINDNKNSYMKNDCIDVYGNIDRYDYRYNQDCK